MQELAEAGLHITKLCEEGLSPFVIAVVSPGGPNK